MTLDEELDILEQFAIANRNMFPDGGNLLFYRTKKFEYYSSDHLINIKKKFIEGRSFKNKPISTIPDDAVYLYIKEKYNKTDYEIENIKEAHNLSMEAEDLIGYELEDYIYSQATKNDWIWCSGNVLRATDFIKKEVNGDNFSWKMLQIKNSDNSENSSSAKIRKGTLIKPWFRRFSKKKSFNWAPLNKILGLKSLSEVNFLKHLKKKFKN